MRDKVEGLPSMPGIYLMRDHSGDVFYVGKATNLRNRVRSYFLTSSGDNRPFVQFLERMLADLEIIVVNTEKEALLLESTLIKKYRPRHNVLLRDDKDYIVLRLDVREDYPRLQVQRRIVKDGAKYFGPYHQSGMVRQTLNLANRYFNLRTCTDKAMRNRARPCLRHQIGRCSAPCMGKVAPADYAKAVQELILFLDGKADDLVRHLQAVMADAVSELRFEEAARIRDQIAAVKSCLEKQNVVMADMADRDAIGMVRDGEMVVFCIITVRQGRIAGSRSLVFREQQFPNEEVLSTFLASYYQEAPEIPGEILLPYQVEDASAVAELLADLRGSKVVVRVPERGAAVRVMDIAKMNAAIALEEKRRKSDDLVAGLSALASRLHLARLPRWMECVDISTTGGEEPVASVVCFRDGKPFKDDYRRYGCKKITDEHGGLIPDDPAMIHEVVSRRLARGIGEGALPDLLVIDGGRGQLNAAIAAAHDLGLKVAGSNSGIGLGPGAGGAAGSAAESGAGPMAAGAGESMQDTIQIVSLAKSRFLGGLTDGAGQRADGGKSGDNMGGPVRSFAGAATGYIASRANLLSRIDGGTRRESVRSPERVFLPGEREPVFLRPGTWEYRLMAGIRDEAHRFAITYHRKKRKQRSVSSALDGIPGLGPVKRKELLHHFGAVGAIRKASIPEIALVKGIGNSLAAAIHEHLALSSRNGESATDGL